jgi:hypothetical protein
MTPMGKNRGAMSYIGDNLSPALVRVIAAATKLAPRSGAISLWRSIQVALPGTGPWSNETIEDVGDTP